MNYRNNNRRNKFRNNNRNFRNNGSNISEHGSKNNFQRRSSITRIHNVPKLIDKFNNLAREALSNGDKILSENYFQHADHFLRISLEQKILRNETKKDSDEGANKEVNSNGLSKEIDLPETKQEKLVEDI